jgi:fibronectin-binding autotransporter adhesin
MPGITIVTRAVKGVPLTHTEIDANFNNLAVHPNDEFSQGKMVAGTIVNLIGINASDEIIIGDGILPVTITGSSILNNNVFLQGKDVGGTARNLIGINASDKLVLGNATTNITAAGNTFDDLGIVTTADINGGTIDGVTIGGAVAGSISATTITAGQQLSLGTGIVDYAQMHISGAFTSGGTSTVAAIIRSTGNLIGASGDTTNLAGHNFSAAITTQAVAETIGDVAQVIIDEPAIVNSTATITNASSLLITGAPTEGSNNYAILVDFGDVKVASGDLTVSAGTGTITNTSSGAQTTGLTLVNNVGTAINTAIALNFQPNNSAIRQASIVSTQSTSGTYADLAFYVSNGDTPFEALNISTTGDVSIPAGDLTASGGFLNLGAPSELTISGGDITATRSYHIIDTESNASTDDLDNIFGGTDGDILILRSASSSRDTTIRDNSVSSGNIHLDGSTQFQMSNTLDKIMFIYDGFTSQWAELSRSNNN